MKYQWIIDQIPDYEVFMTVDELDASSKQLAEEHPDIVKLREVGKSRQGHPIYCLVIGEGSQNAFMFASPHPNEPMGCMLLEYFSRVLAENDDLREELDYTWYLIKCIDIDGTKLNEGWFKGPFTLRNYTHDYFRPAGYEQAEWTFPMEYKNYTFNSPIPETQALMKVIDETKPLFMYSLHNAGFGGTYWYLNKEMPEIWDALYEANKKQGLPLHLGEPEVNYIEAFAPAIFELIEQSATYDFYEKYSEEPPEKLMSAGNSSSAYAAKYGTTSLVTELPYFYDPRIEDESYLDFTRAEAARKNADEGYAFDQTMDKLFRPIEGYISDDNPHSKMVEIGLRHYKEHYQTEIKHIEENPMYQEKCKVSEAFDNLEMPKFYRLFYWTLLRRSCEHELMKENAEQNEGYELLKKVRDEAAREFEEAAAAVEESFDYTVIPIKKLVSVQLESGLVVADQLQKNRKA